MNAPTVYFLQADPPDGPVKIGYTSKRVTDRVAAGQTFNPRRILILAETLGTRDDEARLHSLFAHLRVPDGGTEWFRYGHELRDLVLYLLEGNSLQAWIPG